MLIGHFIITRISFPFLNNEESVINYGESILVLNPNIKYIIKGNLNSTDPAICYVVQSPLILGTKTSRIDSAEC